MEMYSEQEYGKKYQKLEMKREIYLTALNHFLNNRLQCSDEIIDECIYVLSCIDIDKKRIYNKLVTIRKANEN